MTPQTPAYLNKRFIAIVFCWLGIGVLCPWNAFISARPYFQSRLCGQAASIATDVELLFSVVYNVASVLSLGVVLLLQYYTTTQAEIVTTMRQSIYAPPTGLVTALRSSIYAPPVASGVRRPTSADNNISSSGPTENEYTWYMVMVPLGLYLAVFVLTTILVLFPGIPPLLFLILTLVGLFVCGVCTSVASAGIVGTAGLFEAEMGVNPYLQGQAAGGLLIAAANTVTAIFGSPAAFWRHNCQSLLFASVDDDVNIDMVDASSTASTCSPYSEISWETFTYFFSGCIVLAFCMAGYSCIEQYKRLTRRGSYVPIGGVSDDWMERLRLSDSNLGVELTADLLSKDEEDSYPYGDGSDNDSATYTVIKAVQGPAISLFLTYMVTLALFPVISSNLSSIDSCKSHNRLQNDLFTPATFLIFNAGDLLGRVLATDMKIDKISNLSRKLVWTSVARFLFVPLFLLCYSRTSMYSSYAIPSDVFSLVVQFMFAVSSGMLTSICFMHAPGLIPGTDEMQQTSSAILNFSLCLGLLCGSFLSFPLHSIFTEN
jgi:hypothetical protein